MAVITHGFHGSVNADVHPDVMVFKNTTTNYRGQSVAVFIHSANMARRMQNGYRPYHTVSYTIENLHEMIRGLNGAEPYKIQQSAEYALALKAFETGAPAPQHHGRTYLQIRGISRHLT